MISERVPLVGGVRELDLDRAGVDLRLKAPLREPVYSNANERVFVRVSPTISRAAGEPQIARSAVTANVVVARLDTRTRRRWRGCSRSDDPSARTPLSVKR
jgi:hypothetical protein